MVFLAMKRARDEGEVDNLTMANYLMHLSQRGDAFATAMTQYSPSRVFECKTCNRQFPSFQALGGHRASHKKPRLMTSDGQNNQTLAHEPPTKPKSHECSVCGLEFAIGQALGGHMRRHRVNSSAMNENGTPLKLISVLPPSQQRPPVVKKSSSRGFLCLDLNLTPLENDFGVWV